MLSLGIDPGKSGAIAAIYGDGSVDWVKLSETEHDVARWLEEHRCDSFAMLEQVSAMPKQGVSSTFKFGTSYGFLRGILAAFEIPFETVTPVKWQTTMKCRTGGDKNITKAAAQRLYPSLKITHANADAILLAEFCKRLKLEVKEATNGL